METGRAAVVVVHVQGPRVHVSVHVSVHVRVRADDRPADDRAVVERALDRAGKATPTTDHHYAVPATDCVLAVWLDAVAHLRLFNNPLFRCRSCCYCFSHSVWKPPLPLPSCFTRLLLRLCRSQSARLRPRRPQGTGRPIHILAAQQLARATKLRAPLPPERAEVENAC